MMRQIATRPLVLAMAATLSMSACAAEDSEPPPTAPTGPAPDLVETALKVPGFADFLAVDGDTVWVTNDGRVEQWSPAGKRASTAVPRPCGTMAIAEGSLWVANCEGGEVWRINLATAAVEAKIATGLANPKGETNVIAGAGAVWVPSDAAGKVARIDPATNAIVATVTVTPDTWYLAFGFDSVWAVSSEGFSKSILPPTPSPDRPTWVRHRASLQQAKARCGCRNRVTVQSPRLILSA